MAETVKNNNVFVVDASTGAQKFLDFHGLDLFWDKAKDYVDKADLVLSGLIDVEKGRITDLAAEVAELRGEGTQPGMSIADRINAAIAALKLDETYEKVGVAASEAAAAKNAAIESANGYTDGKVSDMASTLRGEMANDLAAAKKYTDDEIVEAVGAYAVEGESPVAASGLRKEIAERDAQVLDAAKTHANGLNEAMDIRMQAVETGVAGVEGKITAAFNDFATKVSDDKVVNTYKELIDYAAEHGSEFTALVGVVDGKADKTYVDGLDAAIKERVTALEGIDHDAYKAADETLKAEINKTITDNEAVTSAALTDLDGRATKNAGDIAALTETVANNLSEAKTYAEQKAAAAEAAAKADTADKLTNYTTTTDMAALIEAAKNAAIADAKSKVDALTEVVNAKADKTYVDQQDAAMLAAAKTYSSEYTDQLFRSVQFVTEADINGLFA
jgi:hypothetical protein